MSSKLLMNNNGGGNMQIQKGTVTATDTGKDITVTGLNFIPNIIMVRITSDISTKPHSLLWFYSSYGTTGIRTDSDGITAGLGTSNSMSYSDNGYTKGNTSIDLNDTSFTFKSMSYGPIQAGDVFEWVAIKYE